MVVLTIYTDKFDSTENVFGNGMSGKVFLESWDENKEDGQEFGSIDEALDHCLKNKVQPNRIDFHYLSKDNGQLFWKFNVQK